MDDLEVNKKIREFFFDPSKTYEEYQSFYSCNNPGEIVRFSTFYLARRDIFYCFGLNPEIKDGLIITGSNFGTAYFAGIWLIYESIITLIESIGIKKKEEEKLEGFCKEYLKIQGQNLKAIKALREAITHHSYGLYSSDKGLWRFSVNPKSEYLIKKGKADTGLKHFILNPFKFHHRFELATSIIKTRLLDRKNQKMRESFNKFIKKQGWVIISFTRSQDKGIPLWVRAYRGK